MATGGLRQIIVRRLLGCGVVTASCQGRRTDQPQEAVELHPDRERNPEAKRPKVKNRELDAMIQAAWTAGWMCSKTRSGHVMCYPSERTIKPVLVAGTPSDHRTIPNTRAEFRRSGLNV